MNRFSVLLLVAVALVASAYAVQKPETANKTVTEALASAVSDTVKRQMTGGRCNSNKFQCTNGQCISSRLLCNGRQDCRDGSDESWAICYNAASTTTPERYHPLKVDENEPNENNNNNNANAQGAFSCTIGQFSCTSGACIKQTQVCDGHSDCEDGSDEEDSICPGNGNNGGNNSNNGGDNSNNGGNDGNKVQCKSDEFRCNNGECIYAGYKCDGTVHCTDNSDEDWAMCQQQHNTRPPATSRPPTTGGNNNWQQKLTPCQVPRQPENGRWRLHRSLCDSNRECNAPANVRTMDPGSYLVYNCDDGFSLNGNRDVLCGPGGKWVHEPTCEQIKCPDLSSSTTEALCLWDNVAVSCEVPAPIGTIADLKCREGFVQEVTYRTTFKNVTCQPDGQWSPRPIKCVKKPKKVKLVLEGDIIIFD